MAPAILARIYEPREEGGGSNRRAFSQTLFFVVYVCEDRSQSCVNELYEDPVKWIILCKTMGDRLKWCLPVGLLFLGCILSPTAAETLEEKMGGDPDLTEVKLCLYENIVRVTVYIYLV